MKYFKKNQFVLLCTALAIAACAPETAEVPASASPLSVAVVEEVRTSEYIAPELTSSDIRPEVGGTHGAVVSEHPLASQIGYEVLRAGGNAVDAAVSMAGVLAVVRPHMNSVGGDALSLFYEADTGNVTAMNASGAAGAVATPSFFTDQGMTRVPSSGAGSITVPGAVSAWAAALEKYGTITLAEALEPAIQIAEDGFMVSSTLAEDLFTAATRLNEAGQEIYRPNGKPLRAGDLLKNPKLAATLRKIASQGPSAMYGGEVGAAIAAFVEAEGGHLRPADFNAHEPEWVEPISTTFQGRTIHTMPPNSQGIVMLQMMAMAESLPFAERSSNSPELLHELVEITKLAFADRDRWVADPRFADIPIDELLDRDYLAERAALIGGEASSHREAGFGNEILIASNAKLNEGGDTVYLMVVDPAGNAVSWIQSLYGTFGSNLVDPVTGVVLQNRGSGFSLVEGHPNQVAPGKRPFHTLMNGLVTNDAGFEIAIGTPGGGGQPQFVVQALIQTLMFDLSPQQAVEAPRFRTGSGLELELETRLPNAAKDGLAARGHDISLTEGWTADYGSVQMIQKLPSGVLRTGADMRREAAAMAY
ncbi:MAG: gamma-glutamyltransferase [Gammaproteobacteria bacterium]|nr:gamma-glutamyltransferase [Gammaproteobacteria bacterium]